MFELVKKDSKYQNIIIGALLLFIVVSEASAQYCIRRCKRDQKMHLFFLGVFFYSFVCFGLYNMYSMKEIGVVNFMWSCMSIITILSVGVFFFHETINIYDIIGIVLVFTGLALVFIKGH